MNLDELKTIWESDCEIGEDLGQAAINCSKLHSKYINMVIDTKLRITKTEHEIAELKARKAKYFRGEMSKTELEELGWQQWHYRTLKSDIGDLIEADSDYQKIQARHAYIKTMLYFLESVLGEIKSRNFTIRASIDWQKFRAGM
jgi:Recombination, repair and ssDNA binding protein UvsY